MLPEDLARCWIDGIDYSPIADPINDRAFTRRVQRSIAEGGRRDSPLSTGDRALPSQSDRGFPERTGGKVIAIKGVNIPILVGC